MASSTLSRILGATWEPSKTRVDPYRAFNYLVEIGGIVTSGFTECSGLQVETEFTDYREGGVNAFVHRFAGPTKYPPLILKHGLTDDYSLWEWYHKVTQGTIERKTGTIYLMSSSGKLVLGWTVKEAFPVKWTGPDLRAGSGTVAIESLELAHRGLAVL